MPRSLLIYPLGLALRFPISVQDAGTTSSVTKMKKENETKMEADYEVPTQPGGVLQKGLWGLR